MKKTQIEKYRLFNVYKNEKLIYSNLTKSELRLIYSSLYKTSKSKPLCHSKISLSRLKTNNKLNLIGYYIN